MLSPDSEFPGDGIGSTSKLTYRSVFREYKRLLIIKWDDRHIQSIVAEMNTEIFTQPAKDKGTVTSSAAEDLTAELDAALAAMDAAGLSDEDDAPDVPHEVSSVPGSPLTSDENFIVDNFIANSTEEIRDDGATVSQGRGRGRRGRGRGRARGGRGVAV